MYGGQGMGMNGGMGYGGMGGFPVVPTNKPVGIFWDIDNCPVPRGKSASAIIHFMRNFFVVNRLNHREFEFFVACDVTRLKTEISDDVNRSGGVTLAHVSGSSKNAADEKLRESMKRFVDTHGNSSPTLILISGDIDFVNDLRAYQTRIGCNIIVLHGPMCSPDFKRGWNEIYPFDTFLCMMDGAAGVSLAAAPQPQQQQQQGPPPPKPGKGPKGPPGQGQGGPSNASANPNPGENKAPKGKKGGGAGGAGGGGAGAGGGNPYLIFQTPGQGGDQGQGQGQGFNGDANQPQGQGQGQGQRRPPKNQGQGQGQGNPGFHPQGGPGPRGPRPQFQQQDNNFQQQGPPGNNRPRPNRPPGPADNNNRPPFNGPPQGHRPPGPPNNAPNQGPRPPRWPANNGPNQGQRPSGPQNNGPHQGQRPSGPPNQGHRAPGPQNNGPNQGPPQNHGFHGGPGPNIRARLNRNKMVTASESDISSLLRQTSLNNGPGQGQGQNQGQGAGGGKAKGGGAGGPPKEEIILMITGLPGRMDYKILKDHLQQYAGQVGGRVKYVNNGQGFITFNRKENADRAITLFNGKEVYGKKLGIQRTKSIPFGPRPGAPTAANANATAQPGSGQSQSQGVEQGFEVLEAYFDDSPSPMSASPRSVSPTTVPSFTPFEYQLQLVQDSLSAPVARQERFQPLQGIQGNASAEAAAAVAAAALSPNVVKLSKKLKKYEEDKNCCIQ